MMEATRKCRDHQKYSITTVCLKPHCSNKSIACSMCIRSHANHQESQFQPIEEFLDSAWKYQFIKKAQQANKLSSLLKSTKSTFMEKIDDLMAYLKETRNKATDLFEKLEQQLRKVTDSGLIRELEVVGFTNIEEKKLNQLIKRQVHLQKCQDKEIENKKQWLQNTRKAIEKMHIETSNIENTMRKLQMRHDAGQIQDAQFEIFVQRITDKVEFPVSVRASEKVSQLKQKTFKIFGIPADQIRLYFGRRVLKDEMTMKQSQIVRNSVITYTIFLRGD